ncbi:hypothetical protein BH24DEI2_BH24DEI2_15280 [soil metagenome]
MAAPDHPDTNLVSQEPDGALERRLLASVEDGLFALDRNGLVSYLNPAAALLGGAGENLVGRNFWGACPQWVGTAFERLSRRVVDGGNAAAFTEHYPFLDKWFDVRLYPLEDGVSALFCDVSTRVATETSLALESDALHGQVGDRTHEVRELAAQLTLAEQDERTHLARQLHDGLQQELHALQFAQRSLLAFLPSDEAAREALQDAEALLKSAIRTTRTVTTDLSPAVLGQKSLSAGVGWLAEAMGTRHGLCVDVLALGEIEVPREAMRPLLFNLVKELLFNVVKHAGVKAAQVRLELVGERLELEVADEGNGFDVDQLGTGSGGTGLGLTEVHKRLVLFGGDLNVVSAPGEGTHVTIRVPVVSLTLA